MNKYIKPLAFLLAFAISPVFANNPASKEYVDLKASVLQTQIDAILSAPKIGQAYGGGIIIYLDNSGSPGSRKGLIASLIDVPASATCGGLNTCQWDTLAGAPPLVDAKAVKLFDGGPLGNNNTQNIIDVIGSARAQAAAAALNFTTAQNCATCTTWYLPSKDELILMWIQKDFITSGGGTNFTPATSYWTSTEDPVDVNLAWLVTPDDDQVAPRPVGTDVKSINYKVRPIRAFTY